MQLVVVAATMPSLVLLSRTRAYSFLRIAGAFFAGFASMGWIAERLLGVHTSVDVVVDSVARHAVWIAAILFLISLVCWSLRDTLEPEPIASDRLSRLPELTNAQLASILTNGAYPAKRRSFARHFIHLNDDAV